MIGTDERHLVTGVRFVACALGHLMRGLGYPVRLVARRPRVALAIAPVLLLGAAAGAYRYALHQWHAAQAALEQHHADEAADRLRFCLWVWPGDPDVRLLAARAARINGNLPVAEQHLNECLRLNGGATKPVQIEFLLMRAQTGEMDEVSPSLVDAVESDGDDTPRILETLSRAYMRRLRLKPALACLNRWVELRPDAARPYHWRGWVLERLNHPKQARADYERALELDASLFPVRMRVAEMLLEDHRGAEARLHLEQLRRQAPDDPMVLARLGTCQLLLGHPKEARQLMEAAIVHLPDDYALQIDLAKLDVQEGHGVEAERLLQKVLHASPAETEALHNLVAALQLQGRTDEAVATLKEYERYKILVDRSNKLLQEVVDSPTAGPDDYAETGHLLILRGNEQLGVYWLEQALSRDSAHQAAHQALAEYYEKKGDREQAAAHRRWLRADAKSR